MIFVILGTQKFQMNRLLKMIDEYAAGGKAGQRVIAQTGQSDYEPANFEFRSFFDKAEFDGLIAQADLIITQGGVGAVMTALRCRKPVIVVPRLAKYGEHVDDHQREIAQALAKKGFVLCCDDGDNLEELISQCSNRQFPEYVSQVGNITRIINGYLDGL